jgi:heat shock protein HslJ
MFVFLVACSSEDTPTPEEPTPTLESTTPPEPTQEPTVEPDPMEGLTQVAIDDIRNIVWQWSGLVETQPAAQSVVPDPENYTLVFGEDNNYNFKADCNVGGGVYLVDGSNLSLELGPVTLAECGPDSLYNQFLILLGYVESFGMRDGNLVFILEDNGRMEFQNGGTAEQPEEPVTCNAGIDPDTVRLDTMGLSNTYQANCIPLEPYDDSQPPGPVGLPDHIEINFGIPDPQNVEPGDPIIYIIPVDAYEQLWNEAGNDNVSQSIVSLREILRDKPEPIPAVPILPYERLLGTSDIQVQAEYLDIRMGTGVRFVTRFSQGSNPVTSDTPQLFYTFQGFSSDGVYLITFFYPVTTDELPTSGNVSEEEQQRVDSDLEAYLEEKTTELNNLSSSDWDPDLNILDAVIFSLVWGTPPQVEESPSPITNINWLWGALIETDPESQSLVPDPLIYTLIFYLDNTLVYQADCNTGSGTYAINGDQLSMQIGVSTQAECGEDSLSDQYVSLLGNVISYTLQADDRLFLGLQDNTGLMIFNYGGPIVSVPPPAPGVPTAMTTEPLNVRSGPGTDYPSYGYVPRGTTFEVIGISEDGGWWVVKIPTSITPSGEGWVSGDFVETSNTENVPTIPTPPLEEG